VRRKRLVALVCVAVAALALAVVGCTSTIRPPPPPDDPATVYYLRDSMHRLLALPDGAGGLTAWSYGDWDWYAHNHDAWYHVFDTVLWPTQATLARRDLPGTGEDALRRSYRAAIIDALVVSEARMLELRGKLTSEFAAGGTPHYNPRYATRFVAHDSGYWFPNNCNDAVAGWLRELGCEVSWVPIRLDLRPAED
jgi:hypothetical protein